jgi:hypothetical protein
MKMTAAVEMAEAAAYSVTRMSTAAKAPGAGNVAAMSTTVKAAEAGNVAAMSTAAPGMSTTAVSEATGSQNQ